RGPDEPRALATIHLQCPGHEDVPAGDVLAPGPQPARDRADERADLAVLREGRVVAVHEWRGRGLADRRADAQGPGRPDRLLKDLLEHRREPNPAHLQAQLDHALVAGVELLVE